MSFEQCISVIHYKSTSLWWCITQRMGTSGKNESRNRFSVISFIWESKPEYCYLKRWSAWPQTTFNTKAHNTLAGTTKTKPRLSPSLQWGQPSPCCSVRDGHHEAWWSREDREHSWAHVWAYMNEHKGMGWGRDKMHTTGRLAPAGKSPFSF